MPQVLKPTITICSDASFSYKHGISTWACYIRTPKKTVKTGGVLKEKVSDSTVAERLGVANALFITNKLIDISKYRLIIYCDNMAAMTKLELKVTPISKYYQDRKAKVEFYEQHIEPYLLQAESFETRHVKGHLRKDRWDTTSKRNYMNDFCDKEAKRLLRTEIRKLKKAQVK